MPTSGNLDFLFKNRFINSRGCWEWVGCINSSGYGQVRYRKKTRYVHRVVAHIIFGMSLSEKCDVMHKCNNRICFNPEHLETGTRFQNMQYAKAIGVKFGPPRKTHCINGHELVEGNFVVLNGVPIRHCKRCQYDRVIKSRNLRIVADYMRSKVL